MPLIRFTPDELAILHMEAGGRDRGKEDHHHHFDEGKEQRILNTLMQLKGAEGLVRFLGAGSQRSTGFSLQGGPKWSVAWNGHHIMVRAVGHISSRVMLLKCDQAKVEQDGVDLLVHAVDCVVGVLLDGWVTYAEFRRLAPSDNKTLKSKMPCWLLANEHLHPMADLLILPPGLNA